MKSRKQGRSYVKEFYEFVLQNEVWFNLVSNGKGFTGYRRIDLENIDTSKFSSLASRRSDKPIKETSAERFLRFFRRDDRNIGQVEI